MNVEQAVAIDVCSALFINNLLIYSYRKRIVHHDVVSANQQPAILRKFFQIVKSTKVSGNFVRKLNGSARSKRKSFEKAGPPFQADHFSWLVFFSVLHSVFCFGC